MKIRDLDKELENLKNTRQAKELLLTLPIPLYLEVIDITKRDNYMNVQEFIREAIRDKISQKRILNGSKEGVSNESKEGGLNESKEPKEGILNG